MPWNGNNCGKTKVMRISREPSPLPISKTVRSISASWET
jgi:hypothetical protein